MPRGRGPLYGLDLAVWPLDRSTLAWRPRHDCRDSGTLHRLYTISLSQCLHSTLKLFLSGKNSLFSVKLFHNFLKISKKNLFKQKKIRTVYRYPRKMRILDIIRLWWRRIKRTRKVNLYSPSKTSCLNKKLIFRAK